MPALLEPVMIGPLSGGPPVARTGVELPLATLEMMDQIRHSNTSLVIFSVGDCVQIFNLPPDHAFARFNNAFLYIARPPANAQLPLDGLVPVVDAQSNQRFSVPYANIRRISPVSAPHHAPDASHADDGVVAHDADADSRSGECLMDYRFH
jgi:hypothetical protein